MRSVIVLGAKGRFGRAAVAAFTDAGWTVTELARDSNHLKACACGRDRSRSTCAGLRRARCDRERGAAPYPDWAAQVPLITDAVIAVARASGVPAMIPGNVYNCGR